MTTVAQRSSRWTPLGIAAMVMGFIVWWPLGLAIIAYILWGGSVDDLVSDTVQQVKGMASPKPRTSGNAAFDAYKKETLKRLEEEQAEFANYVEKLRQAQDEEEFQRFMAELKKSKKTKTGDS